MVRLVQPRVRDASQHLSGLPIGLLLFRSQGHPDANPRRKPRPSSKIACVSGSRFKVTPCCGPLQDITELIRARIVLQDSLTSIPSLGNPSVRRSNTSTHPSESGGNSS